MITEYHQVGRFRLVNQRVESAYAKNKVLLNGDRYHYLLIPTELEDKEKKAQDRQWALFLYDSVESEGRPVLNSRNRIHVFHSIKPIIKVFQDAGQNGVWLPFYEQSGLIRLNEERTRFVVVYLDASE